MASDGQPNPLFLWDALEQHAMDNPNIDNMTLEEVREELLKTRRQRDDALRQRDEALAALETERDKYAALVALHPLTRERMFLTRAFLTCAAQHRYMTC